MNAYEAANSLTLAEYRLWWYEQVGVTPPEADERLTVRQATDERLIREGYEYRRRAANVLQRVKERRA